MASKDLTREPTAHQVAEIRKRVDRIIISGGQDGTVDRADLDRFREDDGYAVRFYRHVHDRREDGGVDLLDRAAEMVAATLRWREEWGAALAVDSLEDFDPSAAEMFYSRGRDADGKRLLAMRVGKRDKKKDAAAKERDLRVQKRLFLYWVNRLEAEGPGDRITLVFDCDDDAIGSDMLALPRDLTMFMIEVLDRYVPDMLNYILVVDMPATLGAIFSILESRLSPYMKGRLRYIYDRSEKKSEKKMEKKTKKEKKEKKTKKKEK